ncbi:MAG: MarR family transcriptional regulator [Hyphomicrobiales bacterium]
MEHLGGLFRATLRLASLLEAIGDRDAARSGLTDARWRLLAVLAVKGSMPVAHLARETDQARQGVLRLVNELAADGFVAFADNPHHKRAKLVALTEKGERVAAEGLEARAVYVRALARDIDAGDVAAAGALMARLADRLAELQADVGKDG